MSGFRRPRPGEGHNRLGGKVATSPRDSTTREHHLPWARCSIPADPRRVKDSPAPAPTRTAAAGACSRGVSAGSAHPAPRPVTAPRPASGPPATGGAGGPPSATAPPTTASNAAATRANATAGGSGVHRLPWRSPRPRASAQPRFRKIIRAARATALVATNSSSRPHAPPISTSVRRPAARRYVASASATSGARSGDAAAHGPGDYRPARRRDQSQRYRQRQRRAPVAVEGPPPEGQRPATIPHDSSGCPCDRPGCYALFVPSRRSPDQHFCSPACRQALRRVRQRDVRRQQRRRRGARPRRPRVRPPP